jgi:hypothetical protein
MAGLLVSIGGLMVGGLPGQSTAYSPQGRVAAVELLAPEFEAPAPSAFQKPAVDLGTALERPTGGHAFGTNLPVITPLPAKPGRVSSISGAVPVESLAPTGHVLETIPIEMPSADIQKPPALPCEPAWMKCLPEPLAEASPRSPLTESAEQEPGGLPPLPCPEVSGPGHSRGRMLNLQRPGHTAPKRLADSGRGFGAW